MTAGRRRWIKGTVLVAGVVVLVYLLPPFHIVAITKEKGFDAVAYVDEFWTEKLIPQRHKAADAASLVAAVKKDPQTARQTYSRSLGLGGSYCYFVAGTGRVVSIEATPAGETRSVRLSLSQGQPELQVSLKAGNIFGNAVRDGTGLLNVNDFANSQDFNALSSAINDRIEKTVLPTLREKVRVGATVQFVGCAEIDDEDADLDPLAVVPFIVDFNVERP